MELQDRFAQISAYINAHRDELIADFSAVIAHPSVRSDAAPGAPFGKDCADCLSFCAELYKKYGFSTELFADNGYALSESRPAGGKTIGLFTHTDVVPAGDGWTYTSPFVPKLIGDNLVGRGAIDNKSAVILSLYAMRAIRDLGFSLRSRILTFLGSNEESGMADVKAFAREQQMPDFSLVPDSGFPISFGQKGMLRFDILSDKPLTAITALSGGEAYNVVLDRVDATLSVTPALEAAFSLPHDKITVVREGDVFRVSAVGKPAHASRAGNGENALLLLSSYFAGLDALPPSDREIFAKVAASLADTDGTAFGIQAKNDLFGATTVACGMVRIRDGKLFYTYDIRFCNVLDKDEIIRRIRTFFAGIGFSYTEHSCKHCLLNPKDTAEVQTFLRVFHELTGSKKEPFIMGGGTYAYYLKNAYACGTYGHASGKSLPRVPERGGVHQADEFVCITDVIEASAIIATAILEIDAIL
ncbi:MAG: Sapep family Mn(2+)-dependent dipeptidase [Clostridia bacterium]|nr:Sapep family Mn(2+)-dependent dipeptidase [Clostridia bacterium]